MFSFDLDCCSYCCFYNWSHHELLEARQSFLDKPLKVRKKFIQNLFQHSLKQNGKWVFHWREQSWCSFSIRQIFSISDYMFKEQASNFRNKLKPVHLKSGSRSSSPQSIAVIAWLQDYFNNVGEVQPNSGFIHLPSYLSKMELYRQCVEELQRSLGSIDISIAQFYSLWGNLFSEVKIPQQTRLGRCNDCVSYETNMKNASTEEEGQLLVTLRRDHLGLVREERMHLANRKLVASTNPDKYHHIIMDGMTMVYMPNIQPIPKGASQEPRFKFHVTGIIDHTFHKRYMYFSPSTLEGKFLNCN